MVLEIISSVTSVISLANAGLGLYRSISGICRSDKSQDRILDELKQIRIQFERLNDHIIYTPSLKAVIDLSQPSQRQVVDLREVKAYLEPVQQAIGQDIISSCMIPTPERLVRELQKNPYDVLDNIRPVHYAQSSSDPSLVPVLFQEGRTVYVGWIKRGLIPMVMGCEYNELWLSRPTTPPPVEAKYGREQLTSISTKVEPKTSMGKTPTSVKLKVGKTVFVNERGERVRTEEVEVDYYEEPLGEEVEPLKMIAIPAGEFWMGSPESEKGRSGSESPQHLVKVPAFFMGQTQITQGQWRAVASLPQEAMELKPDPSGFKGDELPVEQVSWKECLEFCARLSRYTGRNYRLPSEAEWEYACRAIQNPEQVGGGSSQNPEYPPFHFGETLTSEIANYRTSQTYQEEPKGEYREKTTPVKSFPSNAFGLHDMHGNVWERCLDPWHDNYGGAREDGSVWDGENNNDNRYQNVLNNISVLIQDGRSHVYRGGSWILVPWYCRSPSTSAATALWVFVWCAFPKTPSPLALLALLALCPIKKIFWGNL